MEDQGQPKENGKALAHGKRSILFKALKNLIDGVAAVVAIISFITMIILGVNAAFHWALDLSNANWLDHRQFVTFGNATLICLGVLVLSVVLLHLTDLFSTPSDN